MDGLKGEQIYQENGCRDVPSMRSSLSSATFCRQNIIDILEGVSYTSPHKKKVLINTSNRKSKKETTFFVAWKKIIKLSADKNDFNKAKCALILGRCMDIIDEHL